MIFKDPLISIIIPSYNHIRYVQKSIESVINQTYKNIELIIIDDGSDDGSFELIDNLSKIHSFKCISQKNMGICKTLNRGIREFSRGELICILASDDFFHPEKIHHQILAFQSNPKSEFCYTQAFEFEDDEENIIRTFPIKNFSGNVLNKIALRQPYAAGSIMFSRNLYDEVGGFDENLKYEDWDFSIRCAAKTEFIGVQLPLFYYRSHDSNTMKTLSRRRIFHGKALILSKNYLILPPFIWFLSILLHFLYDNFFNFFKLLNVRKIVN